ncbi:DUF302 domain-containing protein [Zoogloeaceae bacterium G21618-S1]|nr:DUF302 domain-containing protein [Zoogloeaceae bacterium G21618-S1]
MPRRPRLSTALSLILALSLSTIARADDIVHQRLNTKDYATARIAVTDAIIDEGLRVASVSNFGDMLARTDADLHHGATPYRHAEVFAFCSVQVAAQLVNEAPEHIAYCPLTIAIYQLDKEAGYPVHILFRPPSSNSPGGQSGLTLLNRIVGRVQHNFPAPK